MFVGRKNLKASIFIFYDLTLKMMAKDRTMSSSLSCDHSRACSCPYNLKNDDSNKAETPVQTIQQWEELRCPICMEPPHNALLLHCSSFAIGCRAFICDTSRRHTNCFDKFTKMEILVRCCEETPPIRIVLRLEDLVLEEDRTQHKFLCPLCRGEIYEAVKVENVRRFLNKKVRSCSNETCDFSGTYLELRNHARTEHPDVQPAKADAERLREWELLERAEEERNLQSTAIDQLYAENSAFRELIDCLFSVMYYTQERCIGRLFDSSGDFEVGNNAGGRSRERQGFRSDRSPPPPPPPPTPSVGRRIHNHLRVRQAITCPYDREDGDLRRQGRGSHLLNSSSSRRGERRLHGYGGKEKSSDGFRCDGLLQDQQRDR